MKKAFIITAIMAVFALSSIATATASSWIPGSNYAVEDSDVSDFLERTFDSAYCSGIPRFGHVGEFPYEKFVVFDCMTTIDDNMCSSVRFKSVKAARRGYYRLIKIRPGHCY